MLPVKFWSDMVSLGINSQTVIAMRMAGMMGMLPAAKNETARMFSEKQDAARESFFAVANSMSRGQVGVDMATAAMKPWAKRASANSRRLTKIR